MMRMTVVLMVLFSLVLAGPGFTAPNGGDDEATRKYLSQELPNTSKAFTACGKEWMLGRRGADWNETQRWIKSLGSGWRTPTIAEVKALFIKVGIKSPIRNSFVWAQLKDSSSAWGFDFSLGYESVRPRWFQNSYVMAVAVRSR